MCYKVRSQEQNERTYFLSYKVCQSHTCVQKQITGEGWGRRVDLGKVLVTQSCPTLCDPTECSPPGSSVHGILQAKILEWVAISFSRVSFGKEIIFFLTLLLCLNWLEVGRRCFRGWLNLEGHALVLGWPPFTTLAGQSIHFHSHILWPHRHSY